MTKRISFVVTVVAVALALAACGRGPGTGGTGTNGTGTGGGGTMPTTPTMPSRVGEWHFAPNAKVTLMEDAFTIAAGDGMTPLGTETPFDAVTEITVSGDLDVMDSTYTLSVKLENLKVDKVEYVDATQAALLTPFVQTAIKIAAESGPATVVINAMHDPPTMTVDAPFIIPLLGLPDDARLRACLDMPCVALYAMEWWNSLNAEQMVAALYGDMATPAEAAAAKMMYADLDDITRMQVDLSAVMINGHVRSYDSVGAWWESLDCREMRIAAGDGNTTDSTSAYCRHYPGSDFPPDKILSDDALAHVNAVGMALLGRDDPGTYPAPG